MKMLSTSSMSNPLFSHTTKNPSSFSFFFLSSSSSSTPSNHFVTNPLHSQRLQLSLSPTKSLFTARSSDSEAESEAETVHVTEQDEWLSKLPDKKKPLYAHSLPCIEAWLRSLGFYQSIEDMAVWFIENGDWHAQLSLDTTDIYIRYLKSGPGNLEKDVERRFSYALSREDIENAVLGGP